MPKGRPELFLKYLLQDHRSCKRRAGEAWGEVSLPACSGTGLLVISKCPAGGRGLVVYSVPQLQSLPEEKAAGLSSRWPGPTGQDPAQTW